MVVDMAFFEMENSIRARVTNNTQEQMNRFEWDDREREAKSENARTSNTY